MRHLLSAVSDICCIVCEVASPKRHICSGDPKAASSNLQSAVAEAAAPMGQSGGISAAASPKRFLLSACLERRLLSGVFEVTCRYLRSGVSRSAPITLRLPGGVLHTASAKWRL